MAYCPGCGWRESDGVGIKMCAEHGRRPRATKAALLRARKAVDDRLGLTGSEFGAPSGEYWRPKKAKGRGRAISLKPEPMVEDWED